MFAKLGSHYILADKEFAFAAVFSYYTWFIRELAHVISFLL
jgi:hypothetical protein